jgi:general stress protein 26
MSRVSAKDKNAFFKDVETAAKKSVWCALATIAGNEPRVRMVHPTWENDVLWIATGASTAKARQIEQNESVDIQFQVAPDAFIHLLVRGKAAVFNDEVTKSRVWNVMDYDLFQFWPDGPESEEYCVVKVVPSRVELSEMFGIMNKRVWSA